jgi:hypothetical protein
MITFIATAYKETIDSYQFISSLMLQKNPNWKCIIHCDEKNEYIEECVNFFKTDKIKLVYNDSSTGYWGHYNRKNSLDLVKTEFVIQTSIQDYYTPNTVDELLLALTDCDMVMYNCVHNHLRYDVLDTISKICKIDWGSFVLRTEIAKKVGINQPEHKWCDGIFVEECTKYPNIKIKKLNKILTVHN